MAKNATFLKGLGAGLSGTVITCGTVSPGGMVATTAILSWEQEWTRSPAPLPGVAGRLLSGEPIAFLSEKKKVLVHLGLAQPPFLPLTATLFSLWTREFCRADIESRE